jgi:uncharacterized protein
MFLSFFYTIRSRKIPVSTTEFLDFLTAVKKLNEMDSVLGLDDLYIIARSCMVKDIRYYDDFDIAFATVFKGLTISQPGFQELLSQWLENAIQKEISEAQKQNAPLMDYEKLLEELEKRLKEQTERHDGGNYWIGTGGTSPFGNSGYNEQGLRIGGEPKTGKAINSAKARTYKEYRTDESLDVRQIKVALKKLRILKKQGHLELSIDKSIEKTGQNCGELELVFERSRKNNLKLLLLMDIGGSMTQYSQRVNRLFSAGHQMNHFKEFHHYYFHNIIYNYVYNDASLTDRVSIRQIMRKHNPDTKVIIVGDALMNPYELFYQSDYEWYTRGEIGSDKRMTGIERLRSLKEYFYKIIWLNPERQAYWSEPTIDAIESEVSMFFLSINGIQKGIQYLLRD